VDVPVGLLVVPGAALFVGGIVARVIAGRRGSDHLGAARAIVVGVALSFLLPAAGDTLGAVVRGQWVSGAFTGVVFGGIGVAMLEMARSMRMIPPPAGTTLPPTLSVDFPHLGRWRMVMAGAFIVFVLASAITGRDPVLLLFLIPGLVMLFTAAALDVGERGIRDEKAPKR
jgi:hypothetical protein